jgi:capsule synthesis protein PGA_cap
VAGDDLRRPASRRPRIAAFVAFAAAALCGTAAAVAGAVGVHPPDRADAAERTQAAHTAPRPRRPPPTVRITALGDLTFGITPSLPPGGAGALLADVRPLLRAGDVAVGNLETPLTDGPTAKCGAGASGCYAFRAPPAYAAELRSAGLDVLNLANNHALDGGAAGQAETVSALDAARLGHTGRPGEVAVVRARGVRVAFVGFAPYPWAQDLRDLGGVRRLVHEASERADVVVATMHAGAEGSDRTHVRPGRDTYLGEDRGDVVAFARAAVEAGADLVVGHGPHVLRGLEWYRGRLIAYSLGNASSHGTLATGGVLGVAGLLDVTLGADGTYRRGRLVPLRLVDGGRPTVDPSREAVRLAAALSREDFAARAAAPAASGALKPPRRYAATRPPAPS